MKVKCECGGWAVVRRSEQMTNTLREGQAECTACGQWFKFTVSFEHQIRPPKEADIESIMDKIQRMSPAARKMAMAKLEALDEVD